MRALGAHVTDQALVQSGGHSYRRADGRGPGLHKATYYFLIDRALAAEAATLKLGLGQRGRPARPQPLSGGEAIPALRPLPPKRSAATATCRRASPFLRR